MVRNKYPEEAVEKILDVAERLFVERGYEHTTRSEEQYAKPKKANPGDVIFVITSENIEDVCIPLAWEGEQPVAISGRSCAYVTESIIPRYLHWQSERRGLPALESRIQSRRCPKAHQERWDE